MNKVEFRTFGTADLRQRDGTAVLSVLAQPKRVALLSEAARRMVFRSHLRGAGVGA